MPYVANKPGLKITRDGKTVELKVGDPCPEAPSWPTFRSHLSIQNVVWIPDGQAHPAKQAQQAQQAQQGKR